jgi:hypothetical protein
MGNVFGAEFRRVEDREHLGKLALVVVAIRSHDTAHAASGADPDEARAQAERTIAFFTAV